MDGIVTAADLESVASAWLDRLAAALSAESPEPLADLFARECHWRDLLAFQWDLRTVSGADAIAARLLPLARAAHPRQVILAEGRTRPRAVRRAGTDALEVLFTFETDTGPCNGVVRLVPEAGTHRAWTLMTSLDEIRGHEDPANGKRWQDVDWKRNFGGENWLDRRRKAVAYADHDPAVLVVGAAQSGLSVAARLSLLGIDTLVVDRDPRIGDSWRNRYHALTLHNETRVNHLPYMPFPKSFPVFIPKDMLANWFELYAEAMELNVWTGTELAGGSWDDVAQCWDVTLSARTAAPGGCVRATSSWPMACPPRRSCPTCPASRTSRARCGIPAVMAAGSTGRVSGRWCSAQGHPGMTWHRTWRCRAWVR